MSVGPSPLLDLLNSRWEDFIKSIPDPSPEKPTARPVFNKDGEAALTRIARKSAQADNADPFAFARARHYMRQGYISLSEADKDASGLVNSRRSQGIEMPAFIPR